MTDKKICTPRDIFAGREIRIPPDDDKSLSNSCAMDKYDVLKERVCAAYADFEVCQESYAK